MLDKPQADASVGASHQNGADVEPCHAALAVAALLSLGSARAFCYLVISHVLRRTCISLWLLEILCLHLDLLALVHTHDPFFLLAVE